MLYQLSNPEISAIKLKYESSAKNHFVCYCTWEVQRNQERTHIESLINFWYKCVQKWFTHLSMNKISTWNWQLEKVGTYLVIGNDDSRPATKSLYFFNIQFSGLQVGENESKLKLYSNFFQQRRGKRTNTLIKFKIIAPKGNLLSALNQNSLCLF